MEQPRCSLLLVLSSLDHPFSGLFLLSSQATQFNWQLFFGIQMALNLLRLVLVLLFILPLLSNRHLIFYHQLFLFLHLFLDFCYLLGAPILLADLQSLLELHLFIFLLNR